MNTITRRGQFTALAILCIVCGLVLIMDNLGITAGAWKLWPAFSLFLGLGALLLFNRGGRRDLKVVGIGVCLVLVSVFFFFLNYTTWSHMALLWPAFIGIFGATILVVAYYAEEKKWYLTSGVFFIFLASAFFLVFTVNAGLWPISLVLFGLWLLLMPERSKH